MPIESDNIIADALAIGQPARGSATDRLHVTFSPNKKARRSGLDRAKEARASALACLVALVDLVDNIDTTAATDELIGAMTGHQGLQ
jgi:hypothetical protein